MLCAGVAKRPAANVPVSPSASSPARGQDESNEIENEEPEREPVVIKRPAMKVGPESPERTAEEKSSEKSVETPRKRPAAKTSSKSELPAKKAKGEEKAKEKENKTAEVDEMHGEWRRQVFRRNTSGTPWVKYTSPEGVLYYTKKAAEDAGFVLQK